MPEPTFQDLLAAYSGDLFVGRADELALFERMITIDRPPCLVLAISGQGGVGKTTLLERFRSIASDRNIATGVADEGQLGVIEALDHLAGQFGRDGVPFDTFTKRLQRYRDLKQQVDADKDAPRGFLDFAARGAARMGMRVFKKHVPIAGDFADVMLSKEAEDRIAEEAGTFATYVAQKFKQRDDRDLLLDTTKELTGQFLIDLSMQAQYRRIVLFLDTYDKTAPVLDGWLRDLLHGQFGQFNANTRVVIAGRYPLGQHWTRFGGGVRQIELCEFSEDEARQYLERSGVTERGEQDQFIRLSNRLPVLLAFLISSPGSVPTEVAGTAVERFLQGFTADERETALLSSVPRYFNQDILQAVLAPDIAGTAFDWLIEQHFVRETERGWAFHDVVRTLLVRSSRHRSPARCTLAHTQLADLYAGQADKLLAADDSHFAKPMWRHVKIESLYHRLSSDPENHLDLVLSALVNVVYADPVLLNLEISQSDIASFATLFKNVIEEIGSLEVKVWMKRLTGLVTTDTTSKPLTPEAIQALNDLFTPLASRSTLGDRYRSDAYLVLSITAVQKLNRSEAISFASKAIELLPSDSYNYVLRGRVYSRLQDHPAALADFSKAIALQPDDSLNYYWRSTIYYKSKDFAAALDDLFHAIQFQPDVGPYYYGRGATYFKLKDYPAALADFSKAIELQPGVGLNYYGRASAYREQKDYHAALVDFSTAIELSPHVAESYARRARTHTRLNDTTAALSDLQHTEELLAAEGKPAYIAAAGYIQLDRLDDAIRLLRLAFERSPELLNEIATDGDFDPIRHAPEFQTLLAEFGSSAPASPGSDEL